MKSMFIFICLFIYNSAFPKYAGYVNMQPWWGVSELEKVFDFWVLSALHSTAFFSKAPALPTSTP